MFGLFRRKVVCSHCGKKHKASFDFAGMHFCSYTCWETFAIKLSTEELITLDRIDRRMHGGY